MRLHEPDGYRSVVPHRAGNLLKLVFQTDGDTQTKKSRRTLALPLRCVGALRAHRERQDQDHAAAGSTWHDNDLVFASAIGTALDAANVRRAYRRVVTSAGLDRSGWTPRELRHSFVSLLSDSGLSLNDTRTRS